MKLTVAAVAVAEVLQTQALQRGTPTISPHDPVLGNACNAGGVSRCSHARRIFEMALRTFIPRSIGKPLSRYLHALLAKARSEQSAALPNIELRAEHVANVVVVTDRRAFLERLPRGGCVAELGVADGDFSALILAVTQPAVLHLVDAWSDARYGAGQAGVRARFAGEIAAGRVIVQLGLSTSVLERFADASLDWVYIDTDHTYLTTRRELAIAARKVKAGGLIAGHDYVTGNWNSAVRYGVVEAVHEFCVDEGWELVLLTSETDRHLSFAIRRLLL